MKSHDRYIERNDLHDASHLQVSVYYGKGGLNFLSGQSTPRGYYLSVKPVTKGNGTISYNIFSGQALFLFGTARFTAKQFEQAVDMAKDLEDELITAVVEKNKAGAA